MKVKFKKLDPKATIPVRGTDGSSGYDIVATSEKVVNEAEFGYLEYGTGLAVEIPKGYAGFLFPRSSVSKTGLILANAVGVIDSDFRNEFTFRFKWIPGTKKYEVGERIGQLVIMKTEEIEFTEVEELSTTGRTGGYGSTGA